MKELSIQEAFSKMVTHLRTQGKRSVDVRGDCQYRGPKGTMCAVGCLIPDSEYSTDMEGKNSHSLTLFHTWDNHTQRMMSAVQNVHDLAGVDMWEKELRGLAGSFKLTMPPKVA